MSKINRFRIVNLSYNNDTFKINDELFHFNGESTLLNLKNGGGKSVLVQMMIAPFVGAKARKLGERTFESYFTSNVPTYILVEWELEQGAGYLLTGMMVRKKDFSSEENSKDKLDIINFIYEYKQKNEFDIENIKVIENTATGKKVISYGNSKKNFEELEKELKTQFNYYDMANYNIQKNYFNKLLEYRINKKEWEEIIKKINKEESGLSKLFAEAKDTKGLLTKWFLPNIEKKIDKSEVMNNSRIDNYRKIVECYIKYYKENKVAIDRIEKLDLFQDVSVELLKIADIGIFNIDLKKQLENKIKNMIFKIESEIANRSALEEDIQNKILSINCEIEDLKYEELSIDIHKQCDSKLAIDKELNEIQILLSESCNKIENLTKAKNILSCAKKHEIEIKFSKRLQEVETKLELLRNTSEKSQDEINNLGYSLYTINNLELKDLEKQLYLKKDRKQYLENKNQQLEKQTNQNRLYLDELVENKGNLNGRIEGFVDKENNFNNSYNLNLTRNLEGVINENLFSQINEKIINEDIQLDNAIRIERRKYLELDTEKKEKNTNKELYRNQLFESELILKGENDKFCKLKDELENRKELLKFIDFPETRIFDNLSIEKEFNKKMMKLRKDIQELKLEEKRIEKEIYKLKTGDIIEIPKDMTELINSKGIRIIKGLEWLKKNGNSEEENIKLINRNPFLPYSIIIDEDDINLLNKVGIDFFTSNPIPIIAREDIEKNIELGSKNISKLADIHFFMLFNKQLLNQKELQNMIDKHKQVLEQIHLEVEEKEKSLVMYDSKLTIIKKSELSLELYEETKKQIEELNSKINKLKEKVQFLEKDILRLKFELKDKDQFIDQLKVDKLNKKKILNELNKFRNEYKKYLDHKTSLLDVDEKIRVIREKISDDIKSNSNINNELKGIISDINSYVDYIGQKNNEIIKYKLYNKGVYIKCDKEDLEAKFLALTSEITKKEEELIKDQELANIDYSAARDELLETVAKYNLEEIDYKNTLYNKIKEQDITSELKQENESKECLRRKERNNSDKKIVIENEIKHLYEKLRNDYSKDIIKDKELLVDKNFQYEIQELTTKLNENRVKYSNLEEEKNLLSRSLDSLSEFESFKLLEAIDFKINLSEITNDIKRIKIDLRDIETNINKNASDLKDKMIDLENHKMFKSEKFFKDIITSLKGFNTEPKIFKEQLNGALNSYTLIKNKSKEDLKFIPQEENRVVSSILEYIDEVNDNLSKIDNNSSIEIDGRRRKMLEITTLDFLQQKEIYKLKLKTYIQDIRDRGVNILMNNENIEDLVSKNIKTVALYDAVIGIDTIKINIFKVEENKQRKITWKEVSTNSGGEGFLSAFIILTSLLSYIRSDENDILTRRGEGKVLIMDNPFAKTNAAHLLKPLMDIAKKNNTQLICLTGLGGESIYNRFDNIYVLNLRDSNVRQGIKNITIDHIKGKESKSELIATQFKIENQLKLF